MDVKQGFLWNNAARALFVGGSEAAVLLTLLGAGMRPCNDFSSVLWIVLFGLSGILALDLVYAITQWRWQRALGFSRLARIFCSLPVVGGLAKGVVCWPRTTTLGMRGTLIGNVFLPIGMVLAVMNLLPDQRSPMSAVFILGLVWYVNALYGDWMFLSRQQRGRNVMRKAWLVGLPLLLVPPCGAWMAIFFLQRQEAAEYEMWSASQPQTAHDLRQRYPANVTPNAAPLYRKAFAITRKAPDGDGFPSAAEKREYFRLLDEAAKIPLARFDFSYADMDTDVDMVMGFSYAVKNQLKRLENEARPDWISSAALVRHQEDFANILGFLVADAAESRRLEFLQNPARFDSLTLKQILLHLEAQEPFFQKLVLAAYQGERAQATQVMRTADAVPCGEAACLCSIDKPEVKLSWFEPFSELIRWRSLAEYWRISRKVESLLTQDFHVQRAAYAQLDQTMKQVPFFALPLTFSLPQLLQPVIQRYHSRLAALRCARVALALELYRRDHGRFPAKPEELLSGYLEKLPVNPFDGKSLTFEVRGPMLTVSAPCDDLPEPPTFTLVYPPKL